MGGDYFPDHWELHKFEDCMARIIDYRGKTPKKSDFGVPLVTAKIIKNGRILWEKNPEFIPEENYERWMRRGLPRSGDIVMTMEAPLGEVAQLDQRKVALAQRIITLRGKEGFLDNTFLKYLIQSHYFQWKLRARSTGTTVTGIKQSELREIQIPIPPIREQLEIGHILGTLDKKIELNERMNATLEAIARALFKSWFVDFDPVRAKLDRRDTGLPYEITSLFPNSFEVSEFGKIPKGWQVTTLDQIVDFNKKNAGKYFPFEEIEYVEISGVSEGRLLETTIHKWEEAPSRAKRLVEHGDTIWSTVRPNRKSYLFVNSPVDNLVVSTGFAVLSPKNVNPCFLYYLVTTDDLVLFLTSNADGAAYPAIRATRMGEAKVILPTRPIINKFEDIVWPLRDRILSNEIENQTLAQLRDSLLPNLMRGEVKILEQF